MQHDSEQLVEKERAARRSCVPRLDAMLGRPLPVLDDGFVRVIDYMGGDHAVVQAARVSYGTGTKRVHQDRGLIRYLLRHRHTTPFEMCEIKLHVRVPMDTWRQWVRHRTANVNEYSTRYSLAIDAASRAEAGAWRLQTRGNRMGSEGTLDVEQGRRLCRREQQLHQLAKEVYQERIAEGVAREQARKDLPLSTYTEAYWKIDLHNLLHFLRLRMEQGAQQEIRAYATVIGREIVARWCPLVWEAFTDYQFEGFALSRMEMDLLRCVVARDGQTAIARAREWGWLSPAPEGGLKPHRERREFEAKLARIGLPVPWQEQSD
ncbi:MAG: FAD-dependent thymidylate synthase [Myxococcota bacterium]